MAVCPAAPAELIRSPRPLATLKVPRVTMKGGSRRRAIRTPLIAPNTAPQARPAGIASAIAIPAWGNCPSVTWAGVPARLAITQEATTPESISTVPTERSMPAVMITKVSPMASSRVSAVSHAMFVRLREVKNTWLLLIRLKKPTRKTSTSRM